MKGRCWRVLGAKTKRPREQAVEARCKLWEIEGLKQRDLEQGRRKQASNRWMQAAGDGSKL